RNVRIVAVCMVAAVVLAAAFRISAIEWIIVVLCCGLVMVTELLNTAIESVTDLACEERHPLAAASKDTAAAATLMASGTALIAGLIIFAPKIINLICCWL
ncbi:MAG: diacylglycerol kinase family protein, partial [Coriobacteriia bacterium]|nr:diacylglycerol kinase family protein [Coriobacteriia bacterium]